MIGVAPIASLPIAAASAVSAAAVTFQRMFILSPQDSDAATITPLEELADLPATNLQTIQPGEVWRSTSAAAQLFIIGFAAPVAANALALVATNATQAGVVRVRGATSAAGLTAAPVVDTATISMWPSTGKTTAANWPIHTSIVTWDNDAPLQHWLVDLSDGGGTLSYHEAGRLVLGRRWTPGRNFDLGGAPIGYDSRDVQIVTPYGRTFTDRRSVSPPRLFELSIFALSQADALRGIGEIQRQRGLWGDVICCLGPGETSDLHSMTMQGCFTTGGSYTLPPVFDAEGNMWGAAIRLREFIQ